MRILLRLVYYFACKSHHYTAIALYICCFCLFGSRHKNCFLFTFYSTDESVLETVQLIKQEAQLSQRDRATLLVMEYFAKSLKIIRNDTVE